MEKSAVERFLSYGSGYGYGGGYGYGYGDGDGSGSGSGDGSGYGIKKYTNHSVHYIDSVPTIIYSAKGGIAKGAIIKSDLTLQDYYIAKVGNFFAHGKTAKTAISDAQKKYNENRPVEERISDFVSTFKIGKKYPASLFYRWHTTLTGSCDIGKKLFIESNGIDLKSKMTVSEFIDLTINQYGSEIIKKLSLKYKS